MLSQRKVICLLALTALIGLVACSGCLWGKPASTEPIVGIWVWTSSAGNTIYTDTFVSDGTYVATSSDSSVSTKTGTWSKIRNNEYLVKMSDGETYTWIYHTDADTITQPEYPNVPSYRQGKQPVTTRLVTTTPTVARTQDPIIGVWRYSSSNGYDQRFRFNSDRTFVESFYFVDDKRTAVFSGTWSAQGGNSYTLHYTTTGESDTFIYDPARNTVRNSKYTTIILTPYQGNVMTAS